MLGGQQWRAGVVAPPSMQQWSRLCAETHGIRICNIYHPYLTQLAERAVDSCQPWVIEASHWSVKLNMTCSLSGARRREGWYSIKTPEFVYHRGTVAVWDKASAACSTFAQLSIVLQATKISNLRQSRVVVILLHCTRHVDSVSVTWWYFRIYLNVGLEFACVYP